MNLQWLSRLHMLHHLDMSGVDLSKANDWFQSSQLSCHLPHQLGQLTNLMLLQLGSNRIAGVIPESIARLSLLWYLYLDFNLISGPIPNSIGELSSLEVLDLSYN
nr:putative leucine-rich repeat protein, plant-type [Tanacetum cinerariifolium]